MMYLEQIKGRKHLDRTNVDGSNILNGMFKGGV